MEFRTIFRPVYDKAVDITHSTPVWLVGSCFSDNIGERMRRRGFDVEVNPLGTLYNPASVARSLADVCGNRRYVARELVSHEGRYHSMMHHSRFSAETPVETLARVNGAIERLHTALPRLSMLIVTLGSSIGFYDRTTGEIVANCHKLPAQRFELREQGVDEIVTLLGDMTERLRRVAPALRVMYTVSPIRHKGYGPVRDRMSKSRLLLAVDRLTGMMDGVSYFPAYDIMMDDLRDYRFYAPDMIHPSEVAADYIYECFAATCCTPATSARAAVALAQWRRDSHRQMSV